MIKILFEGLHEDHFNGDSYVIDPLTSSSILIRTGKHNILVDTGAFYHRQKLLDGLSEEGLRPEDIHCILNTHYHLDHTTNNFLFPNAYVGVGPNMLSHKTGEGHIYSASRKKNPYFPEEIEDLPTPGHSEPHHSYVYREDGVTYIMAGDAVSAHRFREGVLQAPDPKAFKESALKIFEIADVIIPGHNEVIRGDEVKELHEIVKNLKC
ncbi:MAG: MBL fold metallo-hydrolase [Patescibacteria group bacterium]